MNNYTKLSYKRHRLFHTPLVDGKKIQAQPYLTLPFRKIDLIRARENNVGKQRLSEKLYTISEGWIYSTQERMIHKLSKHYAIDYHVPYGTHIVAPCDGYAMASYHSFRLIVNNRAILYEGKKIYFGLGYFIQIYNPAVDRYIQLGHLSQIAREIPFSKAQYSKHLDAWTPRNHNLTINELLKSEWHVPVKQGQFLGRTGFSGLRWDYEEYNDSPFIFDPPSKKSYDEPHLHFEEFSRISDPSKKATYKAHMRDPYDIYLSYKHYPSDGDAIPKDHTSLFLLDPTTRIPLYG